MELMRDLIFVGAEFEGLLSTDPTELPNGKFLVDLTKYFAGFEDSAISIERDGTSGTMTKVAYSLRFCKKPNTMFLKEGYERFISKGRTNFMRGYWSLYKVFYVGNEGSMTEPGNNNGDIALCVDGDAYMWHDDVSEWRGIGSNNRSIIAPNTIVYCEKGAGYTAYINATDKFVEWNKLVLWKKDIFDPNRDDKRTFIYEHDFYSKDDTDAVDKRVFDTEHAFSGADGRDLLGSLPISNDVNVLLLEEVLNNPDYMRIISDIKLVLGFATNGSATKIDLSQYSSINDFLSAKKDDFIRIFRININWESYTEDANYISFEATNPSLQSVLKSQGDEVYDLHMYELNPKPLRIDKTINIPVYGTHLFPFYNSATEEGVRQSIMSTTDMKGGQRFYFPTVSFGEITGLEDGMKNTLTFGSQSGEDVWSKMGNRAMSDFLLKNTMTYSQTITIKIPSFVCYLNYRRKRGETGFAPRVFFAKGLHRGGTPVSTYQLPLLPVRIWMQGVRPQNPVVGDTYFNRFESKIYEYLEGGTWSGTFVTAETGNFHFDTTHNQMYRYTTRGWANYTMGVPSRWADAEEDSAYEWNGSSMVYLGSASAYSSSYEIIKNLTKDIQRKTDKYLYSRYTCTEETIVVTLAPDEEVCFCCQLDRPNLVENESYSSYFYFEKSPSGGQLAEMKTFISSSHEPLLNENRTTTIVNGKKFAVVFGCFPYEAVHRILQRWSFSFNSNFKLKYINSLSDVIISEFRPITDKTLATQDGLYWISEDGETGEGYFSVRRGGAFTDVDPLYNANVYFHNREYGYDGYVFGEFDISTNKLVWYSAEQLGIEKNGDTPDGYGVFSTMYGFLGEEVMYSSYHRVKERRRQDNLGIIPMLLPVESLNGKSDPMLRVNMKELLAWFKVGGYEYSIDTDVDTGDDVLTIAPREYFYDNRFVSGRPDPPDNAYASVASDWDETENKNDEEIDSDGAKFNGLIPIQEGTTIGYDHLANNVGYVKIGDATPRAELHERGELELSTNAQMCYTKVVVGYDKEDYENLAGTNDPNSIFNYTTGYNADQDKSLEMTTKIRMDFYGMMYWLIRSYSDDYDKTSDKTFCVDCKIGEHFEYESYGTTRSGNMSIWDDVRVDAHIVQDGYEADVTYYNAMRTPYALMMYMNRRLGLVFTNKLVFSKSANFKPASQGSFVCFRCEPTSELYGLITDNRSVTDDVDLEIGDNQIIFAGVDCPNGKDMPDYTPPLFTLGLAKVKIGTIRMIWARLGFDWCTIDNNGDDEYSLRLLEQPNTLIRFIDDDNCVRYGFIKQYEFNPYNYKEGEITLMLAYPRRKGTHSDMQETRTLYRELIQPESYYED